MSFQSGLLGAAVTLMGAVSLSTPEVMQIHEVSGQRVSAGEANDPFHIEPFMAATEDSRNICLNDNNQTISKQSEAELFRVNSGSVHLAEA